VVIIYGFLFGVASARCDSASREENIVAMRINREKRLLWSGTILLSPDGMMSNPGVHLIVTNDMFKRD
jgi:hypothetical protein